MSDAAVRPLAVPSEAVLVMPGSKSEANRLLAATARAPHAHLLRGLPDALDVRHMVAGLESMGYAVEPDGDAGTNVRVGAARDTSVTEAELFCGNAGTAARFLTALAAVTPGEWTLTGDRHLARRPMGPLLDALRALGARVEATNGRVPIRVSGGPLTTSAVTVDASTSSQFASALLLVGPSLPDGITVRFAGEVASRRYLELTCRALRQLGAKVLLSHDHARVEPGFEPPSTPLHVTGDWSAMGVWSCLNSLSGSNVRGDHLLEGSDQADEALTEVLRRLDGEGPREVDVAKMPDQFLNLAAVAALRAGETRLVGAANVRIKECDRVHVMARELQRCGVDLEEHEDGLTIRGGRPLRGARIDPEGDHRVAMAFALLGCFVPGVSVADADCVAKSYPAFWEDLEAVHRRHRAVAVVGMRGAGKSTFGRALAAALGSAFVDTDEVFEQRHGEIDAFVQEHGWGAFRDAELGIVTDALDEGTVVATGGGAIESDPLLPRLRAHAHVVYLEASAELLRDRLRGSARPSVTGAAVEDEVEELLRRRAARYRGAADVTIDAELPTATQVAQVTAPRPA